MPFMGQRFFNQVYTINGTIPARTRTSLSILQRIGITNTRYQLAVGGKNTIKGLEGSYMCNDQSFTVSPQERADLIPGQAA